MGRATFEPAVGAGHWPWPDLKVYVLTSRPLPDGTPDGVIASDNPRELLQLMLPSMHSFRHTVASRALPAGESVDEVAFLLGHRDGTVTRTVYV